MKKNSIWTRTADKLPTEGETVIVLCGDAFNVSQLIEATFDKEEQRWKGTNMKMNINFSTKLGKYWCPKSALEL